MSGLGWSQLDRELAKVSTAQLVLLTLIWIAGLVTHTVALTAALPELSHRRALTLSLTGSAVSNVTPLGGALGVGLNYHMTRMWGASRGEFAVYTFVTNLCDVLAKLIVPVVIVSVLMAAQAPVALPHGGSVVALCGLLAAAVTVGTLLVSETAASRAASFLSRTAGAVLRVLRRPRTIDAASILETRSASWATMRASWKKLTLGQFGYFTLLAVLLCTALSVTGSGLVGWQLLAAVAVERLLSLSVLTPGGSGVIEVGLSGFLISIGGVPAGTIAGVLLFRAFTFLVEIPVGGALLAGWWWAHRAPRRVEVTGAVGAALR